MQLIVIDQTLLFSFHSVISFVVVWYGGIAREASIILIYCKTSFCLETCYYYMNRDVVGHRLLQVRDGSQLLTPE